jgi:predicted phage tail protein
MGGSLTEVAMFMEKQQRMQMERDAQARAEKAELEAKFEAQRQQLEAKYEAQLEKQRQAMEAQLEQRLSEAKPQAAADAIVDEQLEAFQERLQSLLTAKLLTQDELAAVEDIVADCIEVCPTASVEAECVDTTLRMLRLSEKMKVDGSFARQLRRKYAK